MPLATAGAGDGEGDGTVAGGVGAAAFAEGPAAFSPLVETGAGSDTVVAALEGAEAAELGRAAEAKLGFCAQAFGGGAAAGVAGAGERVPDRRELGRDERPLVPRLSEDG